MMNFFNYALIKPALTFGGTNKICDENDMKFCFEWLKR